jgi:magnesium-protoporphyrin O-methyltransferase
MPTLTYHQRRGQLETYFDRTAVEAWSRLTSDAPVGRIRATVRAGRDQMRQTLLEWLPADMRGMRLLDAGCGTGALSVEAAKRGADVTAVDLSPTLIGLAQERTPRDGLAGRIEFVVGDMLSVRFGRFDYVVAMDSLIHYRARDIVRVLAGLADRTTYGILFTVAPRTPALTVMHTVGRIFPRGDRAPAIEPVGHGALRRLIAAESLLDGWRTGRTRRIAKGFYISQAMELCPA